MLKLGPSTSASHRDADAHLTSCLRRRCSSNFLSETQMLIYLPALIPFVLSYIGRLDTIAMAEWLGRAVSREFRVTSRDYHTYVGTAKLRCFADLRSIYSPIPTWWGNQWQLASIPNSTRRGVPVQFWGTYHIYRSLVPINLHFWFTNCYSTAVSVAWRCFPLPEEDPKLISTMATHFSIIIWS